MASAPKGLRVSSTKCQTECLSLLLLYNILTFIFYSFLSYHILAQSFSLFLSITTRLSFRHKMPGFLCLFSGLCTQPAGLCPNLRRALPSRPARATPGPRTSGVSALLCQYLQNPNQLSTKTPYPLASAYLTKMPFLFIRKTF